MIARDGGGSTRERLWRWYLAVAAVSGWGFFIPTVAATVGWGMIYVGGRCCVALTQGRLKR